ncbi:RNA-splicing factor [Xylographa soralifera]|nr:RNA-splicing factor [Xylographa soralifera]
MSSNVGLSTPRGSGTSGYVQRNLSHLRPRDAPAPYPADRDSLKHRPRQPDAAILAHDRARGVEVDVFELRDRLEDEGVPEEEIETQTTALRAKLVREMEGARKTASGRGLKAHQVHERAAAKIEESERLRKALGIREDYEEGGHWKRGEERLREGVREGGKGEEKRQERREGGL